MPPLKLQGKIIENLYVLQKVRSKGRRPKWRCECLLCGTRVTVAHQRLIHKTNPKKDCGCSRRGLGTQFKKEYHAWWDAKNRCHYEQHPSYPYYGAKGIRMCDEWRQDNGEGFKAFLEHIKPCPFPEYSLDRINAHGFYEPGNVRWASDKTQARNKKNTKMVKHPNSGELVPAGRAAEDLGMKYQAFRAMMIERGEW